MHAIITLVMDGNSYVPGAVALAKSLRKHILHGSVNIICMITADVTDSDPLKDNYDLVVVVPKIYVKDKPDMPPRSSKIYHWIDHACTKWNVLGFTEYEKVLFMDCDMIAMGDITGLFALDAPAAVFDSHQSREMLSNPDYTGVRKRIDGTSYAGFINWYKVALKLESQSDFRIEGEIHPMPHGVEIPSHVLDNLPFHASSSLAPSGGLVLLEPKEGMLQRFKDSLSSIMSSLSVNSTVLSGIDEISIALFMHNMGYTWHHISMEYNVFAYHVYNIFKDRCKVLHYGGQYKPWITNNKTGLTELESIQLQIDVGKMHYMPMYEVTKIWWDVYES